MEKYRWLLILNPCPATMLNSCIHPRTLSVGSFEFLCILPVHQRVLFLFPNLHLLPCITGTVSFQNTVEQKCWPQASSCSRFQWKIFRILPLRMLFAEWLFSSVPCWGFLSWMTQNFIKAFFPLHLLTCFSLLFY